MRTFLHNLKNSYQMGNSVLRLIYITFALSLVLLLAQSFFSVLYQQMIPWVALSSDSRVAVLHFWTFISYSFFHASFLHLLFNMLVLFYVAQLFKTFFTEIQLLTVYVLGSLFAGLMYVGAAALFDWNGFVLGASAATMALLFAVTSYAPNMSIRLMLIGKVKVWHIAALLVVLDVLQLNTSNSGGHVAHLGGALFGFIYIQFLKKGIDFAKLTSWLSQKKPAHQRKKKTFKKVYTNQTNMSSSKPVRSSLTEKDPVQIQIDVLLDKIKKSGYDSLSAEEKAFLFKQK